MNVLKRVSRPWQIWLWIGIAAVPLAATAVAQRPDTPARVMVYASVGEELIGYTVDIERAALTRQSSVVLPGFVQEAWASSSAPLLYVAWSNGGASYNGSGVAARGDRHGVTAFRVDAREPDI